LNTGQIGPDYNSWWSKWLLFENQTGIQMVEARWQPKMLPPFENQSCISGTGHLNTGFQFVWYTNGSGIQMFGIQIPTV
jgi:hypothetical protein